MNTVVGGRLASEANHLSSAQSSQSVLSFSANFFFLKTKEREKKKTFSILFIYYYFLHDHLGTEHQTY